MQIPLLMIGTAFDGPSNQQVQVRSIEEAYDLFGAYAYENVSLTSNIGTTVSTFSISASGVDPLELLEWSDGELVPFLESSILKVEGYTVTIDNIGRDADLVVRYLRPMSKTDSTLYKGYAEVASTVGGDVRVLRVGGTKANVTVGNVGTITIESVHGGSLYNSATVVTTAVKLTIVQPAGKGEPLYYDVIGKTIQQVATEINLDYKKGYSFCKATVSGSGALNLLSDTTQFSGGANGTFSDSDITECLAQLDLHGVRVVCVLGKLHRKTSVGPDGISGFLTSEILEDMQYPTMFVQGVVYGTDVAGLLTASAFENANVSLVLGECQYNYYPAKSYWASMAPIYAAIMATADAGCTYKPVTGISTIQPYYSESDLIDLASAGYVTFTRSLSKGVVVLSDTSTHTQWDASTYNAYLSVVSAIYPILEDIMGKNVSSQTNLEDDLNAVLEILPLRSYELTVNVSAYGIVYVSISLQPYGKLTTIQFGVTVNANSSGGNAS